MNLDHLLKKEHRSQGLHLEDDEDFVYLCCNDEGLAIWRNNIKIETILKEANRFINATPLQKSQWIQKTKSGARPCNAQSVKSTW